MGRPSTIKVGHKSGKLTVIGVEKGKGSGHSAVAVCACECGKVTRMLPVTLRKSRSCGCSRHDPSFRRKRGKGTYHALPPGVAAENYVLSSYKTSARLRKLPFELSRDEFVEMAKMDCFYCGAPPREFNPTRNGVPMYNGACTINGIDRIINEQGYASGNVVPCCAQCNFMKHTNSSEEFIEKCIAIAKRATMRTDPSTQKEHRKVAEACAEILYGQFPEVAA